MSVDDMSDRAFRLRPVRDDEKWDVLRWRNRPVVRQAMLSQEPISEASHAAWWGRMWSDQSRRMLILEENGVPVAVQVYFAVVSRTNAWWAFYLTDKAPEDMAEVFRLWASVEVSGLVYAFEHLRLRELLCEVRRENTAVERWHRRFGFVDLPRTASPSAPEHDVVVKGLDRAGYAALLRRGSFASRTDIRIVPVAWDAAQADHRDASLGADQDERASDP